MSRDSAESEALVALRVRLPVDVLEALTLKAWAAGCRSIPDYVRRLLCEAVPVAERSALVAKLANGGQVGRGLSRASSATRRTVAQAGIAKRAARSGALAILGERFGLSPVAAHGFLDLEAGRELVAACEAAAVSGGPVRIPAKVRASFGARGGRGHARKS